MKLKKLREYLELAVKNQPTADSDMRAAVNAFFTGLRRHDRVSVEKALGMFFSSGSDVSLRPRAATLEVGQSSPAEDAAVETLKHAFEDDSEFRSALEKIKASRAISREGLNRVYCQLFGKSRVIGSKTTKAMVAQDIADLRLERVRSKKAAQFFAAE